MSDRVAVVEQIMAAFGARTGLTGDAPPRRYLWTDAFAVCNYLALHRCTSSGQWLECARQLIDQVHQVLGRHRPDDARSGWISGLDEATGARHPTAGGLRIGKPLPERQASEPPDEELDWERDGQYYHYLTRWMHALGRAAEATGDRELLRYGVELARAAHAAFTHTAGSERRLYWKMSIDLSEPAVASMGQHDPLDGLVATAALHEQAQRCGGVTQAAPDFHGELKQAPNLHGELNELAAMCHGRGWASADALGIGGLLTSAVFLLRLADIVPGPSRDLLARVVNDAARSLDLITIGHYPAGPAHERLPFRELGLGIGLAAVERLDRPPQRDRLAAGAAAESVDRLLRHVPLRSHLEAFWMDPAHQRVESWTAHVDINMVMLATSMVPDGYLD